MSDEWTPNLHYTGHLIRRAQQLHIALWNQHVSTEISSVQFAALAVIDQTPGMSQAELGGELSLDRSTIADLVERMVKRGLLTRAQSTADRRRKVLAVSSEGSRVLESLTPAVELANALLTDGLNKSEKERLHSLLRKMLAHGVKTGVLSRGEVAVAVRSA